MRITAIEPLGIGEKQYRSIKHEFERLGHEFYIYPDRNESPDEIIRRAKNSEVLISSNIVLNRYVIENLPSLQLLNIAFTGVDHLDLEACRDHKITVSNAAGYSTTAVSELTIGLMLDVLRKITVFDGETRKQKTRAGFSGREIAGKTIGIIGTGAIGQNVATILKAMSADVIAYSRSERKLMKEMGVKYVSLQELAKESDIVSIHIPSTGETRNLIDDNFIKTMKPEAILINTARGPIVDSHALADALKKGKIAGAGIDVYEHEPPIENNHPLMDAPNTVLLPHLAYATKEAMKKRAEIVKENVLKWLDNNPQNIIHQA